ncbi:hypothetical protein ABID29_001836 [Streptococcus rupicaprae]|uniref:Phage protein n=1 Tax=Streptococcus rupicaprae TaxID=759619 RepID=A0ABV2FJT2_9STRE
MKLTLKNNQLTTLSTILERVQPKNMKANRGRAKLIAKVQEKFTEYYQDESDILKEYCEADEHGQIVSDGAGGLKLKDPDKLAEVRQLQSELSEEEITLEAGEYASRYKAFFDWLAEAEDDFSATEVILIDDLLEQYEGGTDGL